MKLGEKSGDIREEFEKGNMWSNLIQAHIMIHTVRKHSDP